MKVIVVFATACAAGWGICGSSERLFRWEPEDAGERNSWTCTSIPDGPVYSVRFDAAILRGTTDRWFSMIVDGTEFRSNGTGFTPQGVEEPAHRDIQFRDRCFHELVVVSSPTQGRPTETSTGHLIGNRRRNGGSRSFRKARRPRSAAFPLQRVTVPARGRVAILS